MAYASKSECVCYAECFDSKKSMENKQREAQSNGIICMQCSRCGELLKEGENYEFHGKVLCEDCYFDETNSPKAYDSWRWQLL